MTIGILYLIMSLFIMTYHMNILCYHTYTHTHIHRYTHTHIHTYTHNVASYLIMTLLIMAYYININISYRVISNNNFIRYNMPYKYIITIPRNIDIII